MRRLAALLFFLVSSHLWAQPIESPLPTAQESAIEDIATDPSSGHCEGLPVMAGISVQFTDNSSAFKPTREQLAVLSDVLKAKMVMIKGRTSTTNPSAKDEAIALARAVAARNWLVNLGVSPLKIYLNYLPAGDHIADNSTKEGRAANQRVDIEAYFVDFNHERTPNENP